MMKNNDIARLEHQGCYCENWDLVDISPDTDLGKIRNVFFRGPVSIGANTEIINVPGGLKNIRIGNNVKINNVAKIENSAGTSCGVGTVISVLDETGSRPVKIYPGISAQVATIAARLPEYASSTLNRLIDEHIAGFPDLPEIGDNVEIFDCGPLIDVRIWHGVKIEGAARLRNCSIVSNIDGPGYSTFIGPGVDAENCIIEDATVGGGSFIRNTYVGQGTVVDKGFTSHDSLFFSNCTMENGETCAVLAGPFTVSMHKSTLLIACQTAFMNAGSGTNMSNHMYKLGPVHWGVLDRGVKTSSNSYLMHGSRIGAFSLLMGDHKGHPDSADLPFSYLIGDASGRTIVVPGAMLKSYGILRDETKWQNRDRRKKHLLKKTNDRINPHIFNPNSISMIATGIETIDRLLSTARENDGFILYKGLKTRRSSLVKGRNFYSLALHKYIHSRMKEHMATDIDGSYEGNPSEIRWLDIAGQIIPESSLRAAMQADSINAMEKVLDKAFDDQMAMEREWIAGRFSEHLTDSQALSQKASEYDALLEKDRKDSIAKVQEEQDMLSLF